MNVLIIEDDPMVAKLNEDFLKTIPTINIVGNYRTTQDAKKLLQEKRVEVILLDNYLPNETGIEFLAELRKENNQVPVILITAANDIETIQQALALGVIDYLVKPFTAERFLSSIQKVMNQKKIIQST